MAYLARELIAQSFYLSTIRSRDLQNVTGNDIEVGLFLLNALLNLKQIQVDLLPYFTYNQTLTTTPNQESYLIPNCAAIQTFTYNIDQVRYACTWLSNHDYFAFPRVNNVSSLPTIYTTQRVPGGTLLYMYFLPEAQYQMSIFGKFYLSDVKLETDLSIALDTSYIEYLRYSLAQYMCSEYGVMLNQESEKKLSAIENQIRYMSPPDLTLRKVSVMSSGPGVNFGDVNIGHMWRPGAW